MTSAPKFSVAGVIAMLPGVSAVPLTALVERPAVLVNTTLLVHVPVVAGANCTTTLVDAKPVRLKLALVTTANGRPTLAVPLSGAPPELVAVKLV